MAALPCIVLGLLFGVILHGASGYICCVPDQFEAILIVDYAVGVTMDDFTDYGYINGSFHFAYDYTNNRTFLNLSAILIIAPEFNPMEYQATVIEDHSKGMEYFIYRGACVASPQSDPQIHECIPDDAVLLDKGFIGNQEANVEIYHLAQLYDYNPFTITIDRDDCIPAYMTSFQDIGMVGIQVANFTKGIKDPSIFIPPPICNNSSFAGPVLNEDQSRLRKLARRLSIFHPFI